MQNCAVLAGGAHLGLDRLSGVLHADQREAAGRRALANRPRARLLAEAQDADAHLRSEVNNFHKIQNFRQISDLFSQI